ncbi:glycosyltransferase family 4 protein [Rhodococcus sp. IEGM 1341]|uniref:glycosyltransferase family 4 protein n=1 Tax=Rhodococcus sp. IEGM 1341 TaxID=3047090 RepID=UPI0024B63FA5|nr:glycosyltransferase family 4 protein [Rhodococcus sp. IEGM 1341]MDI9926235.1 glycosyltransferase family 4 protein [Rhodococcus sp. IEGM 1341]
MTKDQGEFDADILHIGIVGPYPGGMAQVLNGYLDWDFATVRVRAICSTAGKRDPWTILRILYCFAYIVWFRFESRNRRLVVVHLSERGSFVREGILIVVSRCLGLRVVGHLHGANFVSFSQRYSWLVRFVLKRCAATFVLTQLSLREVERLGVADVRVVTNCVAVPDVPIEKAKLFLFGGEVGPRKGVDVLLSAWSRVDSRDWRLVIAGPITAEVSQTMLRTTGVEFLGAVSHADILKLQARALVAVLPSRDEALPMFLIEAMARSCAVISTRVGQIPELVSNGSGILCRAGNVEDLSIAIKSMMVGDVAQSQGKRARLVVLDRFDASSVLPALERQWLDLSR